MVTDDFTGTVGDELASPWRNDDVLDVSKLVYASGGGCEMETPGSDTFYVYDDTFPDDQYASVVSGFNASSGVYVGCLVRVTGVGATFAGYWYYNDGASTEQVLVFHGDGTQTVLWTGAHPAFSTGDFFRLEAIADQLSWYKNGVLIDTITDSELASGIPGITALGSGGVWRLSSFSAGEALPFDPLVHVVSGRDSLVLTGLEWLSVAIDGRPAALSSGAAEPPNWYHVGMVSWGTANGVMTAHPVTRDLELIQIPAGMTELHYQWATGVVATITELAAP